MDLQKEKILSSVVVGMELEFYSSKPRKEIAKEISALVKKKVTVGSAYHSDRLPLTMTWYVEPDFSGGIRMHEIVTEPMPYHEAVACMFKLFTWIKQNGNTDEKCAFQVNISFDKFKSDLKEPMTSINKMKFVLGFDEEYIYQRFPKRKNSVYARSINSIYPINKFVFNDDIQLIYKENYELPSEKYYGINFSKLEKGYIEVRYMGGRSYEKHAGSAKEVLDYVAMFTHGVLQNNYTYTNAEVARLRNAMREFKKVVSSFNDYDSFTVNYPNMRLLVDLKGDREIIRTFYPRIRDQVFNLIVRCGMRRGMINYDADAGKYQVKGAVMSKAFPLKGIEIFDSKITSGNVLECDLFRCELNNCHILDSNVFHGCKIKSSKLINTPLHAYNELTDCFIDNKKHLINCKVEGGIIRSGDIGELANISPSTEIITAEMDSKDSKDSKGGSQVYGTGKGGGKKDKEFQKTAPGFRTVIPLKDDKPIR